MTKVIYRPVADDGCPVSTRQFGYDFAANVATEVTDARHLAKFAGHPHFEVVGDEPPADPPKSGDAGLIAKHIGGGKYAIVNGETRVKGDLTKADAEAFNALSDDDKQAYVA